MRILISRSDQFILGFAILLFLGILSADTPEGLSREGQGASAVFALCLILWVTNALPLAITSLLAMALIPVVGALSSHETLSLFGNKAVFFILGAFILSSAVMKTGLSTRIAVFFLRKFDSSPRMLIFGVLFSSGFMSFWMPEHAVAALLFPVILEIAHSLKLDPKESKFGQPLFLALAWGAVIGGVATFLGGARNPLALGMLEQFNGQSIGFFEWMVAVVPISALVLLAAFGILMVFFTIDVESVQPARDSLEKKVSQLGAISWEEKMVGFLLFFTILSWIFFSKNLGLANIAIFASVALFAFKLITWKDVEDYINWGIILMYGGAIVLGITMHKTGAAEWLALWALSYFHLSPFGLIALLVVISMILTECVSNSAVVALILPFGLGLAGTYGIDPKVMVYCIAVPAGLTFTLPMGSPPNAICSAAGYYNVKQIILPGIIMSLCSYLIFLFMASTYWKLLGISL